MGNACAGAQVNPNPENICGDGDSLGQEVDVPGACFFTTAVGAYCSGAGGGTQKCFGVVNGSSEWSPVSGGASCGVCSDCQGAGCGPGNGTASGCGSSLSWGGVRYRCRRDTFNGDQLKCCRRSKAIDGPTFCFDDGTKARTCDPNYRGFRKAPCVGVMAGYCSNNSEEPMTSKWTGTPGTKDCLRFVQENTGDLNFYGPVISAMVSNYLITQNKPITSPQTDGANHDPFIDVIVQVCRDNAGACDDVLQQKCAGVTREQLSTNVNLANLCGCFLSDAEYAKFTQFGIDAVCDPVCTLGTSVKRHDPATSNPAKFLKCSQSICVIDDVTINLLNSIAGDFTFSQACGNCAGDSGSGSCRCFISDTSIQTINSKIGEVTFNQQCGGGPICFKEGAATGAPPIAVDCATGVPIDNTGGFGGGTGGASNSIWLILGAIAAVILLIIIIAALRGGGGEEGGAEGGAAAQQGGVTFVQGRPLVGRSTGGRAPRPVV